VATVVVAVGLGAAVVASWTVADPVQVTLRTIPFLQIGPILFGVLASPPSTRAARSAPP
jgi:hypothetical protein